MRKRDSQARKKRGKRDIVLYDSEGAVKHDVRLSGLKKGYVKWLDPQRG
jgi:hypothetical protein